MIKLCPRGGLSTKDYAGNNAQSDDQNARMLVPAYFQGEWDGLGMYLFQLLEACLCGMWISSDLFTDESKNSLEDSCAELCSELCQDLLGRVVLFSQDQFWYEDQTLCGNMYLYIYDLMAQPGGGGFLWFFVHAAFRPAGGGGRLCSRSPPRANQEHSHL